jgi:ligand-binding SRPBCC domain-containing protein
MRRLKRDALSFCVHHREQDGKRAMRYSYHTEQWLPYPVEQVFKFFSNPENLPLLMRESQEARIDSKTIVPPPASSGGQQPDAAGSGSQIALSFLPFPYSPFRMHWVAEIVEFKWNERFCDRQLSGPFAYWNHCHYLQPMIQSGISGTLIADDLEYELPHGLIGQLAHRLFLRGQLERTFTFRQSQLARILAQITP